MGESCEVRITNLTDMTPEEFIRRKKIYDVALTSEQVDAMTQQFREAAAWIVGQNEAYIIEIYYRAAERIASGELSAAEARRVVREALEAAGYRADAPGSWRDLKDGTARQKLVLETNVNKAAGYAWRETVKGIASLPAQELVRFEQRDVPRDWVTRWRNAWAALPPEEQKKALPGPRMVALVECRIWNEISRWKDPYPPFDYNSGMEVLPVDAEEAAQLGLVRGEEVPRSEEAEDFGVKKELPESEHGADLREIEQWIKEMEAEIAAEDTRMRAEGIITNSANRVVMNSGPGGEDCRAKSVETCRCKGMPRRKPAQSSAERARKTAEMEDEGKTDDEIYAEQRQYFLDDDTMKDVVDYKKRRSAMTRSLRDRFQNKKVHRSDAALPVIEITKKGIKEMADDKALDKSVRMGCSVGEHEEVLNRVDELLRDGVVTETRAGGQGRHAGNDKVETVSTLKSSYESQVSGDRCEAVFSVHETPDTPPYAYFMYTKKERPKQ